MSKVCPNCQTEGMTYLDRGYDTQPEEVFLCGTEFSQHPLHISEACEIIAAQKLESEILKIRLRHAINTLRSVARWCHFGGKMGAPFSEVEQNVEKTIESLERPIPEKVER